MIKDRIYSRALRQWIRIEIALPPDWKRLRPPFPALILNDSQNQWTNQGAYGGWHTDSIAAGLFRKGSIRPVVLVGVVSPADRDRVYGPPPHGRVDKYAQFLAEELLPAMRRRFKITLDRRQIGVMGASFGANAALSVGLNRSGSIGLVAALSAAPHFGKSLVDDLRGCKRLPMHRLYIDAGTKWAYDQPHMDDSTGFNRALIAAARPRLPRSDFRGGICRGHYHNEEWWRKRVGRVLRFFFGRG